MAIAEEAVARDLRGCEGGWGRRWWHWGQRRRVRGGIGGLIS